MKFVLWIAKMFLKKDVNFQQLQIITETKLLMDRRRVRVNMKQQNAKKEPSNQMLMTMIVYGFMGLFIGFIVIGMPNIIMSMAIVHSYILFMMAMTLITDFSTVLLDTTDNQIILPRPVASKTFFIARLIHILVYLLQFTIALSLIPLVCTFIAYGFFVGVACIATIFLTVMFSVFITYLLYGLILKVSSEEKIKDIISWFQIIMTIVFAAGFQILPRLINFDAIEKKFTMVTSWYHYLLPPMWMANALETVQKGIFDLPHLLMIVLAVFLPPFTFWIMIKFLAPNFAKKIAAMGNTNSNDNTTTVNNASNTKNLTEEKIAAIICKTRTEQAGFELAWKMTSRDKAFKIQFYPSLAYLAVFAFIFVFKSGKGLAESWQNLGNTNMFLWFVYLSNFTMATGLALVAFNDNFAAAWRYYSSPINNPGNLISGSIKTMLIKFYMPIFLILFAFSFYVWGPKIIDDFVLGFFNNIIMLLVMSIIGKKYLPFSTQLNVKQQGGKFVKMILQMLIIGVIVALHYFTLKIWWLTISLVPFSAAACYFLFLKIQHYGWAVIEE